MLAVEMAESWVAVMVASLAETKAVKSASSRADY